MSHLHLIFLFTLNADLENHSVQNIHSTGEGIHQQILGMFLFDSLHPINNISVKLSLSELNQY